MKHLTLLLSFSLIISLSAQTAEMQKFPLLDPINNTMPESFIVEGAENELIMFWIDSTDLHMSKSLDDGSTWTIQKTLVDNTLLSDSLSDLNALKLRSGRILLTYKHKFHHSIYSDDNGLAWSEPIQLVTEIGIIRPRKIYQSCLSQTDDNKIWFVYSRLNVIYNIQTDDGITWTEKDTIITHGSGASHFSSVNSHWNNSLILIYQFDDEDTSNIYESVSIDSGKTWGEPSVILNNYMNKKRPRVFKDSDKSLWLTFVEAESTPFEEYKQNNIYFSKLPNGAYSWGTPNQFTKYVDFDGWQNINIINNKQYISFTSNRVMGGYSLWYGLAQETDDSGAPPAIFETNVEYQNNYPRVNIYMSAKVYDSDEIDSVNFNYKEKGRIVETILLFDDGAHNDKEAGDFIFGNSLTGLSKDFNLDIYYTAVDMVGNRSLTQSSNILSPFQSDGGDTFVFDNNNLWLPINSSGVLADVAPSWANRRGGWFDEARIIFSSGFTLSGYTNGELWANGVASASRIEDYVHGTIDSIESFSRIHVVRSSQPDFYQSWNDWKDAVKQGADFYDGDADGVYDPVDKNSNGKWDEDEDKPSIIGDITAFTVYHDGVESSLRRYPNVSPQGIEIKQTVFSYNKTTLPELANVIFVRYKIENMGTVADRLDSVYFGAWADQDIGHSNDDLFGTDSTLNASYSYNDGGDEEYGHNSPASFISFIQGPPVYIEDETFIDENGNGIYDGGIDTALDTAINRKGELIGFDNYPGAKNKGITTSIHYMGGNLNLDDPDDEHILRNYMLGYDMRGEIVEPCNWEFGEVFNEDCSLINPRLIYSGDPVTQNGWLNNNGYDQRQLGSTGPFNLAKGKPMEIIIAYTVGRGTDHLTSITEARKNTQEAIEFYKTNFKYTVPVGVEESPTLQLPTKFSLSQNYPNPFNPSTTIKYSIPNVGNENFRSVQLKIYDILGREVATLVNKQQKAGNYEITFNASNLTSGIYFYRLQSGSFTESRKMILLK